jgi:hypothetical protein
MLCPTRVDDLHGLGSVTSDVADGGDSDLGRPVADDRPRRPLLLRSDVPWTPEGSAREPSAGSASASSGSGLTVFPGYHPLRSRSGGYNMRAHDAYVADLMSGVIDATEEEKEYFFPQGVVDRLARQESLSDTARRRRKRKKEDEAAELGAAPDVTGGSSSSRRDDGPEGGGQGAAGEGCPSI